MESVIAQFSVDRANSRGTIKLNVPNAGARIKDFNFGVSLGTVFARADDRPKIFDGDTEVEDPTVPTSLIEGRLLEVAGIKYKLQSDAPAPTDYEATARENRELKRKLAHRLTELETRTREENEKRAFHKNIMFILEERLQHIYKFIRWISTDRLHTAVILAKNLIDNRDVALKIVTSKDKAYKEERILRKLDGKSHTIKLHNFHDLEEYGLFILELEYFDGVDVKDTEIDDYMKQVLLAIAHCHRNGIIHRDINPSNVLCRHLCDGTLDVVLADFGNAWECASDEELCRTGTIPYMAPELFRGWGDDYSFPVDIWSAGVTFFELIQKQRLFPGNTEEAVYQQIQLFFRTNGNSLPSLRIPRYKRMLRKMLRHNPDRRPALDLLLNKYFCCTS